MKQSLTKMITELKKYEFRQVGIKTKKDSHFRDLFWPIIPTYLPDLPESANTEALECLWSEGRHERLWLIWVLTASVRTSLTYVDECNRIFLDMGKMYLYFYCNSSLKKAAFGESFNSLECKQWVVSDILCMVLIILGTAFLIPGWRWIIDT